jgi:hypothetical protein
MRSRRRRALTLAAAVLSLTGAAACKGDAPTDPPPVTIAGRYDLRTIDQRSLPYTVNTGTGTVTFVSGTLELEAGADYTLVLQRTSNGQSSPRTVEGTYTVDDGEIAFTSASGNFAGTAAGDEIVVVGLLGEVPFAFSRAGGS